MPAYSEKVAPRLRNSLGVPILSLGGTFCIWIARHFNAGYSGRR